MCKVIFGNLLFTGITRSPILSHFAETLSGLPSIRAYGYEDKFISSFFAKVNQNTNAFLILNSMNRWLGIVLVIYFMIKISCFLCN